MLKGSHSKRVFSRYLIRKWSYFHIISDLALIIDLRDIWYYPSTSFTIKLLSPSCQGLRKTVSFSYHFRSGSNNRLKRYLALSLEQFHYWTSFPHLTKAWKSEHWCQNDSNTYNNWCQQSWNKVGEPTGASKTVCINHTWTYLFKSFLLTASKQIGHLCHDLSLIHIWRCRRSTLCRSRWSPYH